MTLEEQLDAVDEVFKTIRPRLLRHESRREDLVYHYCGIETFKAIVEKKQLWLCPARAMNDYMEDRWLGRLGLEVLEARLRSTEIKHFFDESGTPIPGDVQDPPPRFDSVHTTFDERYSYFKAVEAWLKSEPQLVHFCMCFSSEPDVLSQWRAYGDGGAGFAIGFNPEIFKEAWAMRLFPVEYDEAKQTVLLNEILDTFEPWYVGGDDAQQAKVAAYVARSVFFASIWCKNGKFIEEQEWRLVHQPVQKEALKNLDEVVHNGCRSAFRIRGRELENHLILPYEFLNYEIPAITEVFLGPKNPMRDDHSTLETFLKKNGLPDARIEVSRATYR